MDRPVTTLFLDIGGVLLTNGWDRHARRRAADRFGIDFEEFNERHHLTFDTYEAGKLSLGEYLARTVFYRERTFSPDAFRDFMYSQTRPHPDMIEMFRTLKQGYRLKLVAVSNEGLELTRHRIRNCRLTDLIDAFICSCFVHIRKPDVDIFRLALDVAQADPEEVVYIDDRAMFVDVARGLGIRGIHHAGIRQTRALLAGFGLTCRGEESGREEND